MTQLLNKQSSMANNGRNCKQTRKQCCPINAVVITFMMKICNQSLMLSCEPTMKVVWSNSKIFQEFFGTSLLIHQSIKCTSSGYYMSYMVSIRCHLFLLPVNGKLSLFCLFESLAIGQQASQWILLLDCSKQQSELFTFTTYQAILFYEKKKKTQKQQHTNYKSNNEVVCS